ncbi:hypothetical protein RRF57_012855 [Xylaria bambusicola]|uniref:Secreted protein n=1 Tax=Xylaria bambusicola TaxID=326684 RepID=A0AAN7V033_9PEZI
MHALELRLVERGVTGDVLWMLLLLLLSSALLAEHLVEEAELCVCDGCEEREDDEGEWAMGIHLDFLSKCARCGLGVVLSYI